MITSRMKILITNSKHSRMKYSKIIANRKSKSVKNKVNLQTYLLNKTYKAKRIKENLAACKPIYRP